MDKKHVILLGLRRSGTTIIYRIFSQDSRFTCFDEPFSFYTQYKFKQRLQNLESYHENRFRLERYFSYILNEDEITSDLSTRNKQFLKALCQYSHTFLDITRCHFKIDELRNTISNVLIVLLIRDVRAWITSHIRPTSKITGSDYSEKFFEAIRFNTWRYQEIGRLLGYKGFGHIQLGNIWQIYHLAALKSKPDLIIPFENFCFDPKSYFLQIYSMLDIDYKELDFSEIHKPNKPYDVQNTKWNDLTIDNRLIKYNYWNFNDKCNNPIL